MSKEREAAGAVLQKILDALAIDDLNINSRGLFEDCIINFAAAHYQPLLAAKDAEIAEYKGLWHDVAKDASLLLEENTIIKALLEQAREALQKCATSPWHDTAKIAQEALTAVERAQ